MIRYPFVKPSMPDIKEVVPMLEKIWESNIYSNNGNYVQELEKQIANYYSINKERVVCCSNATVGLMVSVKALDWKKEVALPSFTFPATLNAVQWNNLNFSYLDIKMEDQQIDPNIKGITDKHILTVFPYGCPSEYSFYNKCKGVIVDAASSLGSLNKGMRSAIDNADAIIFSLHATKFMGIGEGGVAILKNKVTALKFRKIINFGYDQNKNIVLEGLNGKMCEILAAIGILKMHKIKKSIGNISYVASLFKKELQNFESPIHDKEYSYHPWQFIPILLPNSLIGKRDIIKKEMLAEYGIVAGNYYVPLHSMIEDNTKNILANTEEIALRTLSLPIYPTMDIQDVLYITEALKSLVKKSKDV